MFLFFLFGGPGLSEGAGGRPLTEKLKTLRPAGGSVVVTAGGGVTRSSAVTSAMAYGPCERRTVAYAHTPKAVHLHITYAACRRAYA